MYTNCTHTLTEKEVKAQDKEDVILYEEEGVIKEAKLKDLEKEEEELQEEFQKGSEESTSVSDPSSSSPFPSSSEGEEDPKDREERKRQDDDFAQEPVLPAITPSKPAAASKNIQENESFAWVGPYYMPKSGAPTVSLRSELNREDAIEVLPNDAEDAMELLKKQEKMDRLVAEAAQLEEDRDARRLLHRSDSQMSNTLSQIADASVAVRNSASISRGEVDYSRIVEISSDFTFEQFQKAVAAGPPKCFANTCNCDACIHYKVATAYAANPAKMANLLTRYNKVPGFSVNVVAQPSLDVAAEKKRKEEELVEPESIRMGKKAKRLLEMLKEKNAISIDPNADFMDMAKYPWRIHGVIGETHRPPMRAITTSPKVKFGPNVEKAINQHLDENMLSLINGGQLEAAHLVIIPTQDFQKIDEKARLKAFGDVPLYWKMIYDLLDEDESIIFGWVNMEVHPATRNKRKKGQSDAQKEVQEEQEREEAAARGEDKGDQGAEELEEIPNDLNDQEKNRIIAANAVKVAARDRQKKAKLAEKIIEAIKALDVLLVPLLDKQSKGESMSEAEKDRMKDLMKQRKKYEKARPNVLAGFPHYDIFVVRKKTLVTSGVASDKQRTVSTFVHMVKRLRAKGVNDMVLQKIYKKRGGGKKGKTDSSMQNDLTYTSRYVLIGHNCSTAIENMKAAGYNIDEIRGVAWQYYRSDSPYVSENWHKNFRNMMVKLQEYDAISLSDEISTWKIEEAMPLRDDDPGDEELLIERVIRYMERHGYYLYGEKCIVKKVEGSQKSGEVVYEDMDEFVRHLTTVDGLKKDIFKKLNMFDARNIRKIGGIPRAEFNFEIVELGRDHGHYFVMLAKPPDQWPKLLKESGGFLSKRRVYTIPGKPDGLAIDVLREWFPDIDKQFISFYDLDMTMEEMKKPPENWLKAMGRYFSSKDEKQYTVEQEKMAAAKKEMDLLENEVRQLQKTTATKKKLSKDGKNIIDKGRSAWDIEVSLKTKLEALEVAKKAYWNVDKWSAQREGDFFWSCMKLLYLPAHRQKSLFLIGQTAAGKTIALCWVFGETNATEVDGGIPFARGLYNPINVCVFGGNFAMGDIIKGVTRMCIINEMTPTRARVSELLTFLEHGQVESEGKYSHRKHGHAGFSKAFTGNTPFAIKNYPVQTKALRDRFDEYYMDKTLEDKERDPAMEAKVRKEKFNIVHYLVTRQWATYYANWWKINPPSCASGIIVLPK